MKYLVFFISLFSFTVLAQNTNKTGILKIWIVFEDKGPAENRLLAEIQPGISKRALLRRAKSAGNTALTDWYDLPLYRTYVDSLKPYLKRLRTQSRWLNALSAEIMPEYLDTLNRFSFVKQIDTIIGFRHRPLPDTQPGFYLKEPNKVTDPHTEYGPSFRQLEQIGIPLLHEKGYHGQGVLIALLDAGYNQIDSHVAFKHLSVIERRDFTDGDTLVDGGNHGLSVLGTIAGYREGQLIGPAYGASFLLARTEVVTSETPIEEDYWVAGLEWAEQRGADIVSSSLGYIDWYSPEDLDGKTAKVSIAADIAGRKGVLVFNSAGNEGLSSWKRITPPADARHVLAIAAVNRYGERAAFSSVGPTSDGRIKPDLAAMGQGVYTAVPRDTAGFQSLNGTSFSCPLAAGAAAVLISAFPDLNPYHIVRAIRETASQNSQPDTLLGWGIINAAAAYSRLDSALKDPAFGADLSFDLQISPVFPNPFRNEAKIHYRTAKAAQIYMTVYDILGRRIQSINAGSTEAYRTYETTIRFDKRAADGLYFLRVLAKETGANRLQIKNTKMVRLKR